MNYLLVGLPELPPKTSSKHQTKQPNRTKPPPPPATATRSWRLCSGCCQPSGSQLIVAAPLKRDVRCTGTLSSEMSKAGLEEEALLRRVSSVSTRQPSVLGSCLFCVCTSSVGDIGGIHFSTFLSTFVFGFRSGLFLFFSDSGLKRCRMVAHCGLSCTSLMTNSVGHRFLCLLAI